MDITQEHFPGLRSQEADLGEACRPGGCTLLLVGALLGCAQLRENLWVSFDDSAPLLASGTDVSAHCTCT